MSNQKIPILARAFTVCHECKDRTPGCHDRCERYRAEKNAYEAYKKEEKARLGREHWLKHMDTSRAMRYSHTRRK